jgi:hypothetical protein
MMMIILIIMINMLMPAQRNSCTHLRELLALTDPDTEGKS